MLNCKQDVLWFCPRWNALVNTQTTLCENRPKKIDRFIHCSTGAFLTFCRVTDSFSSTPKEAEATVTSRAKGKQDITSLWVIHKMCSLHLFSRGQTHTLTRYCCCLHDQNPQIDCMTEELNAKWLQLLLVMLLNVPLQQVKSSNAAPCWRQNTAATRNFGKILNKSWTFACTKKCWHNYELLGTTEQIKKWEFHFFFLQNYDKITITIVLPRVR